MVEAPGGAVSRPGALALGKRHTGTPAPMREHCRPGHVRVLTSSPSRGPRHFLHHLLSLSATTTSASRFCLSITHQPATSSLARVLNPLTRATSSTSIAPRTSPRPRTRKLKPRAFAPATPNPTHRRAKSPRPAIHQSTRPIQASDSSRSSHSFNRLGRLLRT